MVIRRSSTSEVQQLVADVLSDGADADLRREAAVARLRVIGDRAVRQVLAALDAAPPPVAQVALLRVLEGRDQTAVTAAAVRALGSPAAEVRTAAVLLARGLLEEAGGTDLLDRLAALAVDLGESLDVRLAAITSLTTLPGRAARPVLERLASDPDPSVRLAAAPGAGGSYYQPGAEIEAAARGELPADPQRLLDALARDGAVVALPTLHRLVTVVRARENAERRPAARRDWLTVRGAVHRALAARGSRVALYDIRETLEQQPGQYLPDGFADTLGTIGDGTCLEAIAASYAAADDTAWRGALAAAAASIASREHLTKRSAVVKRVKTKWGEALVAAVFEGAPSTRNAERGTRN